MQSPSTVLSHIFLLSLLSGCVPFSTDSLEVPGSVSVVSVMPKGGSVDEGTELTISGENLLTAKSVIVGGQSCSISAATSKSLKCKLQGSGSYQAADVQISDVFGRSTSLKRGYLGGAVVLGQSGHSSNENDFRDAMDQPKFATRIDAAGGPQIWVSGGRSDRTFRYDLSSMTQPASPAQVIGAADFKKPTSGLSDSLGLNDSDSMCWNSNQFFLVSRLSNQIRVYNSLPADGTIVPDFVVGQVGPGFGEANQGGSATAKSLDSPRQIHCNGSNLWVADTGNNRVLTFALPIGSSNPSAYRVYGQADFTSTQANRGAGRAANTLSNPRGVYYDGSRLFVADTSNRRVLIWNSLASSDGAAADKALGQANFSAALNACSQGGMQAPVSVSVANGWLGVADSSNHRVQLWDLTAGGGVGSWSSGRLADRVLGQADFLSCISNRGGAPSARSMRTPVGISLHANQTIVTEELNQRVIIWNTSPPVSSSDADLVLGQAGFLRADAYYRSVNQRSLLTPFGLSAWGDKLIVPDYVLARTMIFENPVRDNQLAGAVIGQPDFGTAKTHLDDNSASATTLRRPLATHVATDGTVFIGDNDSARILVWNSVPSVNYAAADYVLGKTDFTTTATGPAIQSAALWVATASGICSNSSQLFMVIRGQNKIYVLNNWFSNKASGAPADFVLGQTVLLDDLPNMGGVAASKTSLSNPVGIACDERNLWVADQNNNRVLGYSLPITSNAQAASIVLGQENFSDSAVNRNMPIATANTLSAPNAVAILNDSVFVADPGNNRVLGWKIGSGESGHSAQTVIGQLNFTDSQCNRGLLAPDIDTLCVPSGIAFLGSRIAISDRRNMRVVILPLP